MTLGDTPMVLVAKREITEAFRARSTRILLAISAVAVAAIVVIAHFAAGDDDTPTTDLAVVGEPTAAEAGAYEALGDALGTNLVVTPYADDAAAREAVSDGADLAILDDGATLLTEDPVDLTSNDSTLATVINVLRSDLALSIGLADAGLDAADIAAVRSTPLPDVESVNPEDPNETNSGRIGLAVVTNVLLFLLLQTYGGWILQGVTREKSTRVVEVLLSAIRPRQLLIGKVIGIGVVALANAAVLIAVALFTSRVVGLDVLAGFNVGDIAMGGVWFIAGYALYCSAFAAAGALCNRPEDAQGAAMPIMLPMLAGYIVGFTAFGGATPLLWVLAFFPPTAVLAMPVLYALGDVPVAGMLLSLAMTLAAAWLIAQLAAKIYERSILRTGKRLSWKDALRRTAH
ncbi:ABC transporter permease [Desertimonas flava]|jgi:ABC-2 type transport system permease protein|uniref:ABC transporter permease n=1 Tax=Desertimonas flava TaxID=2064846 RepID=UPI000E34B36D|nr:ABC transporter permease [Desertimonas flava]